jgi:hypothetical protein
MVQFWGGSAKKAYWAYTFPHEPQMRIFEYKRIQTGFWQRLDLAIICSRPNRFGARHRKVSRRMETLVGLRISKDAEWKAPITREGQIRLKGREGPSQTHAPGWAGAMNPVCVIAFLAPFQNQMFSYLGRSGRSGWSFCLYE